MMKLKIFSENLAQVNSYLLIKEKHLMVIDPGFNGSKILEFIRNNDMTLEAVVLTHGHYDHIKSIETLAKEYNFTVWVSPNDKDFLFDNEKSYAKAFGSTFQMPNHLKIGLLKEEESLIWNQETFKVIDTPGHTKGSICILYRNWLFSGDTVFSDSIGRTDLYSGNMNEMKRSLQKLIQGISNQVVVYSGHGPSAKWSTIKEQNPYF